MEAIYILNVKNEENTGYWFFTTQEKAVKFIKNNFEYDKPKKVANGLYQGRLNNYIINNQVVDQKHC